PDPHRGHLPRTRGFWAIPRVNGCHRIPTVTLPAMASAKRRLPTNVLGDFFVDHTCIDCATCRWMAPATFDFADGASRVHHQPIEPSEITAALQALVAC